MSKVFIARHGERRDFVDPTWRATAENPHDAPLTEVGIQQAYELGLRLQGENIKHIFASPFYRTVQTAHEVSRVLDLDIKIEVGACEWLNKDWYGYKAPRWKSIDEIAKVMKNIDKSYSSFGYAVFPETRLDLIERAGRTVRWLGNNFCDNGNILIVGHGSSVEAMVFGLVPKLKKMKWVTYCALTECTRRKDGTYKVTTMCDTSFLTKPEAAHLSRYN